MNAFPERPDPGSRILRIALVVSLLVHLVVGFVAYRSSADLRHVLAHLHPKPEPTDETVTLSTAIRIDKRAKAQPQHNVARVAQRPPARPVPQTVPHPETAPVPVVVPQPVAARTPVPQALPRLVALVVPAVVLPILWYGGKVRKLSRASQDRVADSSAIAADMISR